MLGYHTLRNDVTYEGRVLLASPIAVSQLYNMPGQNFRGKSAKPDGGNLVKT